MRDNSIKVLLIPVGEEPRIVSVPNTLKALQEHVGGYIQVFPLDSLRPNQKLGAVAIVHEEGKITGGVHRNRNIYSDGKVFDTFYGQFIVCGVDGDEFSSITLEQESYYCDLFRLVPVNNKF